MVKGFDSERLKHLAIESIEADDSNYQKVFDVIWSNIDSLISDDVDAETKKKSLDTFLKLYAQMIVMESVNLTLNALVETGTLVDDEDSNT
ncbi:hypothetical protein [Virgibacillus kimchii]